MTVFRLIADGRHVDFCASTRGDLLRGTQQAAIALWNALQPEDMEATLEAKLAEFIRKYESA